MERFRKIALSLFGRWVRPAAACVALGTLAVRPVWSADEPLAKGAQIYATLCQSCHGAKGEGTKSHLEPLLGDRSINELAEYITKTMPEGEPDKCVGEDARLVAEYIHGAFYSPTAQARNRPARIELSRLTVRQYQQALADLIDVNAKGRTTAKEERGLRGEYYSSRQFKRGDRVLERIDPVVEFDFGDAGPEPEKFDPYEFSIRWEGSLIAPETGEYTFTVRTEHAARLWVNDQRQPLVDVWVKSGSENEHRGSLRLLAGRIYPLRLEYSKAKQGVNDSKKNKDKPPVHSSMALLWQLPHRVTEVVPARCLSPHSASEVFVLQTPFPPDDRSVGYERGTAVSKAWDEATTNGALEVADYMAARLESLAGVPESAEDRMPRLREFCLRFAERAFRRPLTDDQKHLYVERQFTDVTDPVSAVKQALLLILKSPRFLYRELQGTPGDAFDVASRVSFSLWDSLSDGELWRAAQANELGSREQRLQHAHRMLGDLRARAKIREFLLQWLHVDHFPDLIKDVRQYPEFTPQLATELRTSLELFLEDVVWGEGSDFRRLVLDDSLPLSPALAKFYGVELPDGASFATVRLDADRRAGVLTHPYMLASFAYSGSSSPIHRGVLISRGMLGRVLRPPPEAVVPLAAELKPELTTRERVALQTNAESCMTCHRLINPLGFTLEHFDAVGRFRAEEQGKPIDATGTYVTRAGTLAQFGGVRDLAKYLADSDEAHASFVTQLFHYLVKQPIRAYGPEMLTGLQQSFRENGYSIRKLAAEIVARAAVPPS